MRTTAKSTAGDARGQLESIVSDVRDRVEPVFANGVRAGRADHRRGHREDPGDRRDRHRQGTRASLGREAKRPRRDDQGRLTHRPLPRCPGSPARGTVAPGGHYVPGRAHGARRRSRGGAVPRGLVDVVEPATVTVVVNTGDDDEFHGLWVCPDLDSVTYTLAGAHNPETGWGLAGETFATIDALDRYGDADVVPARRPRPRHPPVPHRDASRGRDAHRRSPRRSRPPGASTLGSSR